MLFDFPVDEVCELLDFEPLFVAFCFFAFGAAFRLPFFCVHFITVSASVSNSAMTCSSVWPAQTASRIFLHEGLDEDAAASSVGYDALSMSPATATCRYRISLVLPPAGGADCRASLPPLPSACVERQLTERRIVWPLHE